MQEKENSSVCLRLKSERARLGLKQEEVGRICDTTVQTIRRWEKGTPVPSDKLAMLIQHGFDAQYILSGVGSENLHATASADTKTIREVRAALELFAKLDPEQRRALLAFLDAILKPEH